MIYEHWSDYPKQDNWFWKNFSPRELACPCCGEYYHDIITLNYIQNARDILGSPITVNSAHRCRKHNRKVGGALNSQHLKIAIDVSIRNRDRYKVLSALKEAGFTSFGYYNTFIHTDTRPGRRWYGKGAKKSWTF